MKKIHVNVGDRFGRLTIETEVENPLKTGRKFLCLCDCGNASIVFLSNLRKGNHSNSCGCYSKEVQSERSKTHGKSQSKEYKSWQEMKYRCKNPMFGDYFGRGITVFSEWVDSFESFFTYIGPMPVDDSMWTIERIDVNGNYEPGNVKWETNKNQNRNRRKFKNNTSGVAGVMIRDEGNRGLRYIARWYDACGKLRCKSFSHKKYGSNAWDLAVAYREQMIKELAEESGIVYGESHGS